NKDSGILLHSVGTTVVGNCIGVDRTGVAPLGNGNGGVAVPNDNTTIAGNVISANAGPRIGFANATLGNPAPVGSRIGGNIVGLGAGGGTPLGEGGCGVYLARAP